MIAKMRHIAVRTIRSPGIVIATLALVAMTAGAALVGCEKGKMPSESCSLISSQGPAHLPFDTFGERAIWTYTLRLNEVVEKDVDPTALTSGSKWSGLWPPGILKKGPSRVARRRSAA